MVDLQHSQQSIFEVQKWQNRPPPVYEEDFSPLSDDNTIAEESDDVEIANDEVVKIINEGGKIMNRWCILQMYNFFSVTPIVRT